MRPSLGDALESFVSCALLLLGSGSDKAVSLNGFEKRRCSARDAGRSG